MNYVKQLEKQGSLKTNLKKIFKDVDKRLKTFEADEEEEELE